MDPPATLEEYFRRREVPRDPVVPDLSRENIAAITHTVFVPNSPRPSDLFFVFGASDGQWELVASLFKRKLAPLILVTGRAGEDFYATGEPQAHRIRATLLSLGIPAEAIVVEDRSDNTLENVRYGKAAIQLRNISGASVLFVCKSHHAGRAWRTLAHNFLRTALSCATYDATYAGVSVNEHNWYEHEVSRRRVYGEFQRIRLYAERGDIASFGPSRAVG